MQIGELNKLFSTNFRDIFSSGWNSINITDSREKTRDGTSRLLAVYLLEWENFCASRDNVILHYRVISVSDNHTQQYHSSFRIQDVGIGDDKRIFNPGVQLNMSPVDKACLEMHITDNFCIIYLRLNAYQYERYITNS